MKQHGFFFAFASIAGLLVATPALGQLSNFPVLSLAPGSRYGTTSIATAFGSGAKNNSMERSVFVARVERGLQTVSFGADVGYIAGNSDLVTAAGSFAAHLFPGSPVQVSLQTGLGWIRQDVLNSSLTTLHLPVGVSLQGSGFGKVRPWVMPRVSFTQYSGTAVAASRTDTEYGGSAGISFASGIGFGLSVAYDYLDAKVGQRHRLGAVLSFVVDN